MQDEGFPTPPLILPPALWWQRSWLQKRVGLACAMVRFPVLLWYVLPLSLSPHHPTMISAAWDVLPSPKGSQEPPKLCPVDVHLLSGAQAPTGHTLLLEMSPSQQPAMSPGARGASMVGSSLLPTPTMPLPQTMQGGQCELMGEVGGSWAKRGLSGQAVAEPSVLSVVVPLDVLMRKGLGLPTAG